MFRRRRLQSIGLCLLVVLAVAGAASIPWTFGSERDDGPTRRAKRARPNAAAEPAPDDYRSEHFLIHTDLQAAEADDLLDRLETMLALISDYWQRPLSGIIECYVVKDLRRWPDGILEADGREKIAAGAGVTISRTLAQGNRFLAKSVVYAVADHGTPQHEAVHAYCSQTFGTTGPTWYSEGMAEMGHYWRKGDSSVQLEDVVLEYLRESEPKSINEIVNKRDYSGDSWKNYAWRWALCHLLANNTNYADEFRPLGMSLLTRQPMTFEQVYGEMANEISFEYLEFLRRIETGYRCDLCSWDWQKKFSPLRGSMIARVQAARGWQPTGALLAVGKNYTYTATGGWQIETGGAKLTADGKDEGAGRLVGALFNAFALGEPFDLGAKGSFEAPGDGKLFVRCQDEWGKIADNKGHVTLKIRAAK